MAALGGAPQRTTRVNGRPIPPRHTHDPSSTTLRTTRGAEPTHTQVPVQGPYPPRTPPLSRSPAHEWQVYLTADRRAHSTIPTALRPPCAVASATNSQSATHAPTVPAHGPTSITAESSASPHTHDALTCHSTLNTTHMHSHTTCACPCHTPQRPHHHHHPLPPTTAYAPPMANPCHFHNTHNARMGTARARRGAEGARGGTPHTSGNASPLAHTWRHPARSWWAFCSHKQTVPPPQHSQLWTPSPSSGTRWARPQAPQLRTY